MAKPYIGKITPEPNKEVKPGYKTTEFWAANLATFAVVVGALDGVLPPKVAAFTGMAAQIAYILSRGLAKQ